MSCLDPTAASEFVEGVIAAGEAAAIEAHLAECSDCRTLLATLAASSAPVADEPAGLAAAPAPGSPADKSVSAAAFLGPGSEIGRFVIREQLGHGGMGVVYRAHDPELDRSVAIKLLRFEYAGDRAAEAEARFVREARAMARLSHPNVVTVYEVGVENGYVFIAMELLEGQTFEEWRAAAPRSAGEIVETMIGAGRGLEAAHQAGLVHRDFKPKNIVVDARGKAVVLDFGLVGGESLADDIGDAGLVAAATPGAAAMSSSSDSSKLSLTRTGAVLGTPAYMAPEQHLGEPLDARCDQWAFAACLYEALCERHPFPARDVETLRKKVLGGEPPALPKKIPARIRKATTRALARAPAARFPSMAALVGALEPPASRPWVLGGVALVTVAGFAAALSLLSGDDDAVCRGGEARVSEVWNPAASDAMRQAFTRHDLPFASDAAAKTIENLDQYFNRWSRAHRDTCEASRVRRELSEPLMERALACLDDRLREAEALTALLARADRGVVARAEEASGHLSDLDSCRDRQRLLTATPEPVESAARDDLDELRAAAAAVKALIDVGQLSDALARARELAVTDSLSDYPIARAEASYWLGRALEAAGYYAEADRALRESAYAAISANDDRRAILAATALVRVVGARKADVESGEVWHRIGRAQLARSGSNPALTRDLDVAEAHLLAASGKFDEAEVVATRVLGQLKDRHGADDVRVAEAELALGTYCADQYRYDCGEEHLRRALDIWTAKNGPDHPTVATALTQLGTTAAAQGKFDEALADHRRAIEIRTAGLGPDHPDLGRSYHNIAYPLLATGKLDEALAACKRALEITRASLGPDHPRNAATLYTMGYLYWTQKKYDEAYASHERALELRTAAFGPDHAFVGDIHIELGRTRRDQGRLADAVTHYRQALTIRRKKLGSTDAKTVYTLTDLGSMHVLLGEAKKALALLEEADNHWRSHDDGVPAMVAMNSFFLARALWDSGGSKTRARELGREGLAGYQAIGDDEAVARARRWLASH